jgi:hypothetical protein
VVVAVGLGIITMGIGLVAAELLGRCDGAITTRAVA